MSIDIIIDMYIYTFKAKVTTNTQNRIKHSFAIHYWLFTIGYFPRGHLPPRRMCVGPCKELGLLQPLLAKEAGAAADFLREEAQIATNNKT